jgi:hypothetical protein
MYVGGHQVAGCVAGCAAVCVASCMLQCVCVLGASGRHVTIWCRQQLRTHPGGVGVKGYFDVATVIYSQWSVLRRCGGWQRDKGGRMSQGGGG